MMYSGVRSLHATPGTVNPDVQLYIAAGAVDKDVRIDKNVSRNYRSCASKLFYIPVLLLICTTK